MISVFRHQGEQCLCITKKKKKKSAELLYRKSVGCAVCLVFSAFSLMQFELCMGFGMNMIDVRGGNIVLKDFVRTCLLAMDFIIYFR